MGIVTTKLGQIQGVEHEAYETFFGIPFAKAPIGELRFESPVPVEPWEGILVADHFREKAIQEELGDLNLWGKEFYQFPEYNVKASEDCLFLNIWKPKQAKDCPVAVWIHGGALKNGYPSEITFDGEALAKQGIMLVTVAYRCNVFGFLPTPGEGHRANLGLQDQIEAVNWVKKHIASFGGDSSNITVFGQSAGAMSTLYLCSSELTKGVISKAIMQSGATYKSPVGHLMSKETADKIYKDLLTACGCKSLDELKKIPAFELYYAFSKLPSLEAIGGLLGPVVDGYVLKAEPDQLIEQGSMHKIPYLFGGNMNDMWTENAKPEAPCGELWDGMNRLAAKLTEDGQAPYLYYFAHALPGNDEGAFHSAELWYMFGTLHRSWRPMTEDDDRLSEEMVKHWANFMKAGTPLDDKWKAYPDYKTYL